MIVSNLSFLEGFKLFLLLITIVLMILMMDEDEYTPSSSFQCRSFSTGIEKKKDERRKRSQERGVEKKRGEQLSWQRDDREM